MTSEITRRLLLQIAREAIEAHVRGTTSSSHDMIAAAGAFEPGGAFVTIRSRGELRGCIGRLEAVEPLAHVIAECAVSACSADPRFPPVTSPEVQDLDIEVSLLGPLERLATPTDFEIGRHGLVVEREGRKGLLLPQVGTEWNWDCETFLAHTCLKAGLPRDAWRNGAIVWRFEAEVFGESDSGRAG